MPWYDTMLVPLDGSLLGERALPYAEAWAGTGGAHLILLQVLPAPPPGRAAPSDQRQATAAVRAYLERHAVRLAARGIVSATSIPQGDPGAAIVNAVAFQLADLVILATHGRSGLGPWIFGRVAAAILRRSSVPVLLVPAWLTARQAERFATRSRVLVSLDGSAFAETALDEAVTVVRRLGGELVLLRVVAVPSMAGSGQGPGERAGPREEATQYLRQVAGRVAGAHPEIPLRWAVRAGEPAAAIADTARAEGATLVAMATHGASGLARLAVGSVADGVVRQASSPLLLVRPEVMPLLEALG